MNQNKEYATITTENNIIDLRELFQIIKRSKKPILIITFSITIFATIYAFVSKPLYQVKAMIEIGKLEAGTKNEKSVDNVADLKQKLEYIYGVKSKKKRAYPKVKAIGVTKKAKGIFTVLVEGHSNEEAISFVETIVQKIEKEYQEKINTYVNTQKELITLTEEDINTTKENLKKINKTLDNYSQKIMNISAKDAALAGIYTIQISQNQERSQTLQAHISELKANVYNKKLAITPLRIKQTHLVGAVEVLDKPIKPKKALIIIVALITGLMFSIFIVFFRKFLQGLREEK